LEIVGKLFFKMTEYLQMEDGEYLLQENGDKILLEPNDFTEDLNENYSLNDIVRGVIAIFKEFLESYILGDQTTKQTTKSFLEEYNLNETYSKIWALTREFVENISISEGDIKSLLKLMEEQFNISKKLNKEIQREYSESASLSEQIKKYLERRILEEISLEDSIQKIVSIIKSFQESLELIDEKERIWNLSREYSESIDLSPEVTFGRFKELVEGLNLSDGDVDNILTKLLEESFSLTDKFIKFITSWVQSNAIKSDIQDIIQDEGITATLIRQTETTKGMGDVSAVSEQEYTIYIAAQDIIRSDRQIHEMGLTLPGTERVFMFHEYPDSITGNGTLIPQTGDLIKDDEDVYWRIEEITAEREMEGSEIFKSALIKKVDLT
jgi:hypothetical protein